MTDREALIRKYDTGPDATDDVLALFDRYGWMYRWYAVSGMMLGSVSTLLAGTIINVAIPDIMGTFGMGQTDAQWLSAGFLAATTITMLMSAWCVNSFGIRSTYLIAMTIFIAGSILGGFAPNKDVLIISRFIQGAGSGLTGPVGMLVMFQVFPLHQRGRSMGIFSMGVVLAPALGPTLGGTLVDDLSWRFVFFSGIPLCAVAVVLGSTFLPGRISEGPRPRFDWIGLGLLAIFVPTLLIGLANGQKLGWASDRILGYFAISGLAAVAFLAWECLRKDPLMDLRVFLYPTFAAAAIVTLIQGAGLYASTYLLPLFLQTVQGLTATDSGLLVMPAGLFMAAVFPLAGNLSDRIPAFYLIISGLLIFALSSFLMSGLDLNTPYWTIVWWMIVGRIGLGLMMPTMNRTAVNRLPFWILPQAAGAINFLRQLGGAFGVNIFAVTLERRTAFYGDAFMLPDLLSSTQAMGLLRELEALLGQAGASVALQQPGAFRFLSQTILGQASVMAYRDVFLMICVVFLVTLVPALFMDHSRPPGAPARRSTAPGPRHEPGEPGLVAPLGGG